MNEGLVRIGGRTIEIGRLRSFVSLAAGLALGVGLAAGVVSAAPGGPTPELNAVTQALRSTGRFAAGRVTEVGESTLTLAVPTPPAAAAPPAGGTAESPPIQTRVVRLLPQTRLPSPRPRPGDFVLVVGQPEPDGTLSARALTIRRPGQSLRRQAAVTTTRIPTRA